MNKIRKTDLLIVDNDPLFRKSLIKQLKLENFILDEAADGNEAIKLATQKHYDIILLDIKMEEKNEIEVLKFIKRLSPNTDVVMLTDYGDIQSAVESIRHGATNYIVKPINVKLLIDQLKKIVSSREAAKQLQEIQIDFPALVLHKLRKPLSTVKSALSFLFKDLQNTLNEKQQDLFSYINDNINKITITIDDLIDIAHLESDKSCLDKLAVNLDELVPAVCSQKESLLKKKNITLNLNIEKNVPTIEIDSDRLEKVLSNILDNAIEYTPPGGKIQITMTNFHKDEGGKLREYIEIMVSDNGIGIPKNILPTIFNKYKSEPINQTMKSGLGLALCKLIVSAHNGFLTIESEEGKGTIVKIELPVESNI